MGFRGISGNSNMFRNIYGTFGTFQVLVINWIGFPSHGISRIRVSTESGKIANWRGNSHIKTTSLPKQRDCLGVGILISRRSLGQYNEKCFVREVSQAKQLSANATRVSARPAAPRKRGPWCNKSCGLWFVVYGLCVV